MIAILAIAPDGSGYSAYLDTFDIHEARREQRRLERLEYSCFQLVSMPIQDKSNSKALATRSPLVEG
jgi:hypothetical protein